MAAGPTAHAKSPKTRKAEIAPLLKSSNISPILVEEWSVISYALRMIKRIRHKGLERFFATGDTRGIDGKQATWLRILLSALHAAAAPAELNQPGFRLHPLKGERKGQWAVTVSGNWRLVFEFEEGNVTNVDLVDYH